MTDLRKAAEMVLDTLEWLSKNELPKKGAAKAELDEVVIPTLRQALAHEEKPLVKSYCGGKPNYCTPEVTPEVIGEAFALDRGCWERGCVAYDERDGDGVTVSIREWVGLTDGEIENLWEMAQAWNAPKHFYILIAAKLKEKNA